MYVVKGKRVGDLQDISCVSLIYVEHKTRKEIVKVCMSKPNGLLKVLWECGFMDTSKDICTYYTLRGREDNYGNKIIETSLRYLMQN